MNQLEKKIKEILHNDGDVTIPFGLILRHKKYDKRRQYLFKGMTGYAKYFNVMLERIIETARCTFYQPCPIVYKGEFKQCGFINGLYFGVIVPEPNNADDIELFDEKQCDDGEGDEELDRYHFVKTPPTYANVYKVHKSKWLNKWSPHKIEVLPNYHGNGIYISLLNNRRILHRKKFSEFWSDHGIKYDVDAYTEGEERLNVLIDSNDNGDEVLKKINKTRYIFITKKWYTGDPNHQNHKRTPFKKLKKLDSLTALVSELFGIEFVIKGKINQENEAIVKTGHQTIDWNKKKLSLTEATFLLKIVYTLKSSMSIENHYYMDYDILQFIDLLIQNTLLSEEAIENDLVYENLLNINGSVIFNWIQLSPIRFIKLFATFISIFSFKMDVCCYSDDKNCNGKFSYVYMIITTYKLTQKRIKKK